MSFCSRSVLLALMIVLYLQSCTVDHSVKQPHDCCFSFYKKVIPVTDIKKYKKTRMDCQTVGVIFTTKKNIHVCVDAGLGWVQKAIEELDRRPLESTTNLRGLVTEYQPKPTKDQDGHEAEAQTRPAPETLKPGPATDQDGHEAEAQTQPASETLRPDQATDQDGYEVEPNWFCQIKT